MEKSGLSGAQSIRERLDESVRKYEQFENEFKRVEQSGQIPTAKQYETRFGLWKEVEDLKKRLADEGGEGRQAPKDVKRLLKKEVDPEEIAEVVSQWTGIPVAKMLTTERDKLLKLEDQIHLRMVGQDDAGEGRRQRRPPEPRRVTRPESADRLVPLSRPDRRWQDRAGQSARRIPLRQRGRHRPARYERIWRAAQRRPIDRRPSRLCRLRGRRAG